MKGMVRFRASRLFVIVENGTLEPQPSIEFSERVSIVVFSDIESRDISDRSFDTTLVLV
jgi:hypothetical protein